MMAKQSSSSLVLYNNSLSNYYDTQQVGESVTTLANEVKDLGCWFDRQFKLDTHINNICKAAFFHLFNIRRIRKCLSMECTKILVNAFVTSHLDYCHSLLYGLPNNQLHKLQHVQNAAARLNCNVSQFDHIYSFVQSPLVTHYLQNTV